MSKNKPNQEDIFENLLKYKEKLNNNTDIDDEMREIILEEADTLVDMMYKYYMSVYSSNISKISTKKDSNSLKEYQEKLKEADNKRRVYHNSLIVSLVFLDRIGQKSNLGYIYGKFSEKEISNARIVIDNFEKRTSIANDVFDSIGKIMVYMQEGNTSYSKGQECINEIYHYNDVRFA